MRRKTIFIPKEYYHVYNRVILNTPAFQDYANANKLHLAFLLANSTKSGEAFLHLKNNKRSGLEEAIKIAKSGKRIVNILCYSIMPDHYHLLLQEIKEKGISNFLHKSNVSIAKYINIKSDRRGPLFENRFQAKHIKTNEYLLHLSVYIHLNPLDFLVNKGWRKHQLKNWKEGKQKLLNYPWMSLKAFLENHKDPIISGTKIITDQFNSKKDYEQFLREWSEELLDEFE